MSTLVTALKSEITRLARKEIKGQIGSMKSAINQYRHDIAALKRIVDKQAREIEFLSKQEQRRIQEPAAEGAEKLEGDVRFSARSVRAQRKRLGLSAADFGKLIGVSSQTIYNWEQEFSKPREQQFAAFVAIRGIGKREAMKRLALLDT